MVQRYQVDQDAELAFAAINRGKSYEHPTIALFQIEACTPILIHPFSYKE